MYMIKVHQRKRQTYGRLGVAISSSAVKMRKKLAEKRSWQSLAGRCRHLVRTVHKIHQECKQRREWAVWPSACTQQRLSAFETITGAILELAKYCSCTHEQSADVISNRAHRSIIDWLYYSAWLTMSSIIYIHFESLNCCIFPFGCPLNGLLFTFLSFHIQRKNALG